MPLDLKTLIIAARDTVQAPREGARAVINMNLPITVGALALILMAVISAVLAALMYAAFPIAPAETAPQIAALEQIMANPVQLALVQGAILSGGAFLMYRVGKGFGGKGSFPDAVMLLAWLEFILLLLQMAQAVTMVFSPPMSQAIGVLGFVIFLWLLANFTAELHSFSSVFATFLGIVGSVIALSFAAAVIIALTIGGRVQ